MTLHSPYSTKLHGQKPALDMSDFCHIDTRSDDWLPTLNLTSDDPQHPSSDRNPPHALGLDSDQPSPPTGLGLDSDQLSSPIGLGLDSDRSSQTNHGTQHLGLDSSDPPLGSQEADGSLSIGLDLDLYGSEDGSIDTLMGLNPLECNERTPQSSFQPMVLGIDSPGSDDWPEYGGGLPCGNSGP